MRKTHAIAQQNPLIIALYPHQKEKAHDIARLFDNADIFEPDSQNLKEKVQNAFSDNIPIIGLCAAAILIRLLAPLIKDKRNEPPVIAISEDGNVIPLLGGHRGANTLARTIAQKPDMTPIITTASEHHFNIALDDPPPGWHIMNPEHVKHVTDTILKGASLNLLTQSATPYPITAHWIETSQLPLTTKDNHARCRIICSDSKQAQKQYAKDKNTLLYIPKRLILGVGCVRHCPPDTIRNLVEKTLNTHNLSPKALALIVSVDIKEDETALHDLAQHFERPIRFFTPQELRTQKPHIKNPSPIVDAEIGTPSVAEAAALHAASLINAEKKQTYTLSVEKQKNPHATCAIVAMEHPIETIAIGKKRGILSVVGLGPGDKKWHNHETRTILTQAKHWVGYHKYLTLAGTPPKNTQCHPFQLGEEEKRAVFALNLAAKGDHVALICSGDPGIYAMASPLFDILNRPHPESADAAHRVHIQIAPAISAMHAAAAKVGAPLGQDFCAISLSDLLTPKKTILKRLRAAAKGDFVIALYNPQSKTRTEILPKTQHILLKYRAPETPVAIAENVGREKENIHITTLKKMQCEQVTMDTVIIVGSSQTKTRKTRNAKHIMWTPRGYHNKK